MSKEQFDFMGSGRLRYQAAEQNRDVGILMSEAHANDHVNDWSDQAMTWVKNFLESWGDETFLTEDIRAFATKYGLKPPPNDRAWGGVICRAAKAKMIVAVGYAKTSNPNAHRTPATLWRKV